MSAIPVDGTIDDAEHRRQLRRAVLAATIGTAIEWYDFFLYSTVTGLVFARLYFPRADPFLSNLAVLAVSAWSGDQFLTWGWRVPFLFSIVLIAVGLYIRLGILETPVFRRLVAERRIERTPVLEVIRRQPREIILTALCRMGEQAPFYVYTAFVFAYGTGMLHLHRDFLLTAVLAAAMLSF